VHVISISSSSQSTTVVFIRHFATLESESETHLRSFRFRVSLSATNHVVRIQSANPSRATGEPSAVAATQTVQINSSSSLKAAELLPAAVTHHHPPHTAHRSSVHPPSHRRHLRHLHSQQVWLKTSLLTSQTRLPLGSLHCSSAKRMLASSLVVTS
jgi:hypothetical protein